MVIRPSGYNDGAKEYLEEGKKSGRELTRDELDERIILDGDLGLTQVIYQQIPDKGQERYTTFTLSFREEQVSHQTLIDITREFKQFLMYAYEDDEYNFYAEAHLPKIKELKDKRTGELIVRKPHIHVLIPRRNLLTGKEMNPRGVYDYNCKYFEAFQEYINQKYNLASPREHVRVNPYNAADVLSRYKGDDFRGKNREFKQALVKQVINSGIRSRKMFYLAVAQYGETRIRNKGKENEYIAVKLPGDEKFTNLKETIFNDSFIIDRKLTRPPLAKEVISARLREWPMRAKELKYIAKASKSVRDRYYRQSDLTGKLKMLSHEQQKFYQTFRGQHELHPAERKRNHQRSAAEIERRGVTGTPDGLQSMSSGDVATDRDSGEALRAVLLPGDAYLHLGQQASGRSAGLRSDLPTGGRRGSAGHVDVDRFTAVPGIPTVSTAVQRAGYRLGGGDADAVTIPPYARSPHRVADMSDIEKRGTLLFGGRVSKPRSRRVTLLRRRMPKPVRNASFVAACFMRRHEQAQMVPAQRREIFAIDKKFFEARRAIFGDARLSRKEKAQYIAVLTFERMKAHHAITQPDTHYEPENLYMGSADIRKLIKDTRIPNNSISGTQVEEKDIPPARERFTRIIDNINAHMSEQRMRCRQRVISAADLYTRRARLSKNVHYLDKRTDRTLFVDTGNAIALRRQGMTDSAVQVALELAKEKFGSTLTIKGSKAFKAQVIDVVAKNSLDIHFTDKAMNKALEAQKEALAIEKEGQRIERLETADSQPGQSEPSRAEPDLTGEVSQSVEATSDSGQAQRDTVKSGRETVHQGVLVEHGAAAYRFKPDMDKPDDERNDSYYVVLRTDNGESRTLWGVGLKNAVEGLGIGEEVRVEDKGTERVTWTETGKDGTTVEKSGNRRLWAAEPTDWARQQARQAELNPHHNTDGPDVA